MTEQLDPSVPAPRRIGGWLVLAGMQLIATPILVIYSFGLALAGVTGPLAPGEFNLALGGSAFAMVSHVAAPIALFVAFVRRRRSFPNLFIWWILVASALQIVNSIVAELTLGIGASSSAVVYAALMWVPYFARNPRIKETFVTSAGGAMSDIDAFRQQTSTPRMSAEPVSGIGGWLILPMLGLILSPFVMLYTLWDTPESLANLPYLNAEQATMLVLETIANAAIGILAPVALLVLFFRKLRIFPFWYIVFLIGNAAFIFVDLIVGYVLFADIYDSGAVKFFDRDTIRTIVSSVSAVVIWVPYMLISERVKNTFVN